MLKRFLKSKLGQLISSVILGGGTLAGFHAYFANLIANLGPVPSAVLQTISAIMILLLTITHVDRPSKN